MPSLRSRWTLGAALASLFTVALWAGRASPERLPDAAPSPLYQHISDLSANGMEARVWKVGDAAPLSDAGNRGGSLDRMATRGCTSPPGCGPTWAGGCTADCPGLGIAPEPHPPGAGEAVGADASIQAESWGKIKQLYRD